MRGKREEVVIFFLSPLPFHLSPIFTTFAPKDNKITEMSKICKSGILLLLSILLAACSEDTNDKLEGKWQLQSTEAGGVTMPADTVFYNFQASLFMYQIYDKSTNIHDYAYGYKTFPEDENTVCLNLDNTPTGIPAFLERTDWETPTKYFTIEKLTAKQLILSSDGKRYIFRKY